MKDLCADVAWWFKRRFLRRWWSPWGLVEPELENHLLDLFIGKKP